jgi:hypothetical protein
MKTLILFLYMFMTGYIEPTDEHEGRQMYSFTTKEGKRIENAYKGEIINYLKTGTFEYDEDCGDYLLENYQISN